MTWFLSRMMRLTMPDLPFSLPNNTRTLSPTIRFISFAKSTLTRRMSRGSGIGGLVDGSLLSSKNGGRGYNFFLASCCIRRKNGTKPSMRTVLVASRGARSRNAMSAKELKATERRLPALPF
eukprot:CAMPEP_0170256116 /NCGR_PEP_ID=MMETSP0116_2-20130129/27911_1 /TAXON_ID=400756 /ORGANISM="Durinskia baltica, Strain CSIRO CS-38" /LENGTH=121 /DNA_ID=CAMNT_0010507125 /DNA_START=515 /DNA_END=880 /DNA_ORIENTATION=+